MVHAGTTRGGATRGGATRGGGTTRGGTTRGGTYSADSTLMLFLNNNDEHMTNT